MRQGGGRQKGASFERKVAGLIIAAFAHKGITKEDCSRTRCPGKDLSVSAALRKYFPYAVECKHYARLDWHKLFSLTKGKGHWSKWWRQTVAATGDKKPLLIVHQNNSDIFCLLRRSDSLHDGVHGRKRSDMDVLHYCRPYALVTICGERLLLMRFKRLLGYLCFYHFADKKGLKS